MDATAAADSAEAVLEFVNTHPDAGGRAEKFGNGEDLRAWASGRGLLPADAVVTDANATAARELLDALVSVLLAHQGPLQPAVPLGLR